MGDSDIVRFMIQKEPSGTRVEEGMIQWKMGDH